MSRLTIAFAAALASIGFSAPAMAQILVPSRGPVYVPRGASGFSQGYTYLAPSYYPYPIWTYDGFFLGFSGTSYPGNYLPRPLRMSEMPGSPLQPPPDALPAQRSPLVDDPWSPLDPARRDVVRSSPAARAKALDLQATGDGYLRQQKYQHAYSAYRQAIQLADDLPALHLRYGIVFAMLGRYDRAAMEFRRATYIDPDLPRSEFTLESLFGPDSQLVRASFLSRVTKWVGEDVADPDRQYLLGVLLHFSQDERAQELFSAAYQLTNGADHIVAFLPRVEQSNQHERNLPKSDARALPLPPPPRESSIEPPPRPGLEQDSTPPKSKEPPAKIDPPTKKSEESTSFNGPILLPPSPK